MSLGKRMRRIRAAFGGMRMERKLFLVFLLLITLPLTFIGYISYSNYSRSIEEKTIVYSTKMLENMMVRVDDYIEDMVRISSIPAYQDEIKQNLIRSNSYYEQRQQTEGDNGGHLPDDFNLLLSIQRGIENNLLDFSRSLTITGRNGTLRLVPTGSSASANSAITRSSRKNGSAIS